MRVVLLAGFLGSGKTTLAIGIARAAQARGLRAGLVINERGETGVDNQLAVRLGLDVSELLGGCICCSLAADLAPALERLAATTRPDVVIIEPTGIAEPAQMRAALAHARVPGMDCLCASVVDAPRIEELLDVLAPLITSQVGHADVVIVGKADLATPAELEAAQRIVDELGPRSRQFRLDARQPLPTALLAVLLP